MGPVGRFTKDRVSPAVWWPLAIVLLGLFALTYLGEDRALRGVGPGTTVWFVDTSHAWIWYRWALGIAAGIVLLLALLSFRRSVARIGAGVPFYPSSLPAGQIAVDAQRLAQLEEREEESAHARDRIASLERRLRESETNRRETEGELQRALAARASGRAAAEPEAAEPEAAEVPASAAPKEVRDRDDDVVKVPEIDPPADRADTSAWPEVVVLPRTAASSHPSAPPADESAVDMLNRMVEPVETPQTGHDPSLLRSKLARTAAMKKPGSRERRDELDEAQPTDA